MKRIDFRTLKKEEILLRPQSVKNGKVTLLCYQDARCAMDILDDTLGTFGWQKKYEEIKGNVYCSIGIKNEENGEWVWKSDCGAESNIEKEKGEASDATKRAAVCWGIGRELYTAPRINIDDDGYGCSGYKVSEISYDDNREIIHLVIVNRFGKETFRWDANSNTTNTEAVNKAVKSFGTGKEYDYHEIWAKYCQDKTEKEGIDVNYARSIYKSGLNDASRWKYKDFWPSTLWNNLVKTA